MKGPGDLVLQVLKSGLGIRFLSGFRYHLGQRPAPPPSQVTMLGSAGLGWRKKRRLQKLGYHMMERELKKALLTQAKSHSIPAFKPETVLQKKDPAESVTEVTVLSYGHLGHQSACHSSRCASG